MKRSAGAERADEAEKIAIWVKGELDRAKNSRSNGRDSSQETPVSTTLAVTVTALQEELATLRQKLLVQEKENRHLQAENTKLLGQMGLEKTCLESKSAHLDESLRQQPWLLPQCLQFVQASFSRTIPTASKLTGSDL